MGEDGAMRSRVNVTLHQLRVALSPVTAQDMGELAQGELPN
jgi:hypothetical protein